MAVSPNSTGNVEKLSSTSPAQHYSPHPLRPPHLATMFAGRLAARAARSGASIAPRAVIRSYATPAAASQNILPPIALYGIDGTYATALVRENRTEEAI